MTDRQITSYVSEKHTLMCLILYVVICSQRLSRFVSSALSPGISELKRSRSFCGVEESPCLLTCEKPHCLAPFIQRDQDLATPNLGLFVFLRTVGKLWK